MNAFPDFLISKFRPLKTITSCPHCLGTGIIQPDPGPVPNLADNECPHCDGYGTAAVTTTPAVTRN